MNDYFGEIGVWPVNSKGTGLRYVVGYVLSLLITVAAYVLVTRHLLPQEMLLASILGLAILELIVQMECFLHLGHALSMRARVIALSVALLIVAILVVGSLWIMYNLSQRMMPSTEQMEQYMNDQGGF
jgi:cytochrome o ubiquinol oxidase subunit IV